ncbi:MAG TPA: hypothetical protein VKA68_13570 [bacterium]|nr:hypothetical protein [bacterium]
MKRIIPALVVLSQLLGITGLQRTEGAFLRQHLQTLPWLSADERLLNATQHSPVEIASINRMILGAYYTRLFNVEGLQEQKVLAAVPFSIGNVGVSYLQFGDAAYREQTLTTLIGMHLTEDTRIGLGVHGYQLAIDDYGATTAYGIDIGAGWEVTPDVEWEIAYANVNQATIGRQKELLPQQIFTALRYAPTGDVLSQFYLVHELEYAVRYGVGLAYQPLPWISGAIDFMTNPVRGSYGIQFYWKQFHIFYVAATHPALPFTHRFGIVFTL